MCSRVGTEYCQPAAVAHRGDKGGGVAMETAGGVADPRRQTKDEVGVSGMETVCIQQLDEYQF